MKTPPAPKSKLVKVRADQLAIHPYAQRDLVPSQLRRLLKDMDLDAVGTLHAVEYSIKGQTKLWVIDGQHRLRALLELGLGEWQVEVKVHADVTDDARASALFLKLNTRATVSPFDKFKNKLKAKDDDAIAIEDIVLKYGLKIARNVGDGCVVGVCSLEKSYHLDAGDALDKTLGTTTAAWGKRPHDAKVIEGIAKVYARYNGTIDRAAMVTKLAKYPGGCPGLVGDARGLMEFKKISLTSAVAERVVDTYNLGRRIGKLDPL